MHLQYVGKSLVYLDQNILDAFVKKRANWLFETISKHGQAVYSDVTLTEIKNSIGYENKFLGVLDELSALHIQIHSPNNDCETENKIKLTASSSFEIYDEFIKETKQDFFNEPLTQLQFKLAGGRKGDSISDVLNEQKLALNKLQNQVKNLIANLEPDDLEEAKNLGVSEEMLKSLPELIGVGISHALGDLEDVITKSQPNTKDWNSVSDLREALQVGPKVLNNIKPPKVVEKIWDMISDYLSSENIYDAFFPNDDSGHTATHLKALKLYNLLNSLGYRSDSSMTKERKFRAALNDNNHAMWASFCSVLISADENFVKKARAVYEYLNIKTEVIYVPH